MAADPLDHEAAYLAADDPRGQSGFRGDAARWERLRLPVIGGVGRDGAFMDIGCANGHFLETAVDWAGRRGVRLEPYGIDASFQLVALARRRLPQWADRFSVGDAATAPATRRYDYVRTELVYVPRPHERRYVRRLLDDFVAPGGLLIVAFYGGGGAPRRKQRVRQILEAWGHSVEGEAWADDPQERAAFTDVAWVRRPEAE